MATGLSGKRFTPANFMRRLRQKDEGDTPEVLKTRMSMLREAMTKKDGDQ